MHHDLNVAMTRGLKWASALALLVACAEVPGTEDPSTGGAPSTGGTGASSGAGHSAGGSTGGTATTTGGTSSTTGGTTSTTGGTASTTGGTTSTTGGTASTTGGTTSGTSGAGGSLATGGAGTGGAVSAGGAAGTLGLGGGAGSAGTSGGATGGFGAGGLFGGAGRGGAGGPGSGGMPGGAGSGTAGSSTAGSGGSGSMMPPTGANSVAYIGCSMAYNIGTGYKRVGGKVMWNSDSYQTSAMVVQNWTDTNSSSWKLFDQKMNSIGGKDTVKAIMIQICIFSSRATDAELKSMIASARNHVNPGTHIYMVGQPQYEAGHECTLAGTGGAKWTDDQAKALAADSSVNQDMTYLGQFKLDSSKGEVLSDSCHASSPSGENALGQQAMAFFGG